LLYPLAIAVFRPDNSPVLPPKSRPLAVLLTVFVLLALIDSRAGILRPLEHRLSDLLLRLDARTRAPDPDIVIVEIDDASLTRMAELADRWPWPRAVHGELIAGLAAQHPRAIVFDVMFAEPDRMRPESDQLFNDLARPVKNVYFPTARNDPAGDPYGVPIREVAAALGITAGREPQVDARASILLPQALTRDNWRLGLINLLTDSDGVARRYYVTLAAYGWNFPSLPARVAADLGFPVPQVQSVALGWSAMSRTRVAYADLYEDFNRERRLRPSDEFKDKIVIIGANATGMHDLRATPLSKFHPGVDILATALDNLKNRDFLREARPSAVLLLTLLALTSVFLAFRREWNTLAIGAGVLASAAALLVVGYLLASRRTLLPVFQPIAFGGAFYFACAMNGYLQERRERLRAVDFFSRFVNPHVVRDLLARGGFPKAGENREITVLFSDIRGFTSLSERLPPEEVLALLNRYFGRQVEVILRHGGCLDKFIGDAIMAFWGAPLDDPDHARHAVMAALEMSEQLDQFKRELGEDGVAFDVGIGLNSGAAIVGLMGSENKREYTAIGDTVNVASRIEGLTKGVARILVSEQTRARCAGAVEFAERGQFKLKGREQAVRLYEPIRRMQ
jgi:adenylate cyclase